MALRRPNCSLRMILAAMAIGAPGVASAQDQNASRIADRLIACQSIKEPTARLACYDRATEALATARDRKELAIVDRAQMRKTKEALFGFSLPKIKIFGNDEEDAPVTEIQSTISAVHSMGYGKWAWTLADGSTWQTTEAISGGATANIGDAMTVQAGILGSYNAKLKHDTFKVKRIR